ncbi:haloacid dehalogenase [Streptomyces sulfonofaciens]|uniref:Haloacid dehalogenase n=1 Tax=Streptomyces sulfonofaciens TaxID=68272 RepID=A0A919GPH4_9ACTN|nr:HAD-IA family hydrolase [Streptomyces sulfonofaciens]GHH87480.1 haloacid dehalogenase [Streptomyces sulfonofaciens]
MTLPSSATRWETPAVRAVLFDLDGTLWDPEPHVYRIYAEVFHSHGQELTRRKWSTVLGTIGFDLWSTLEELTGRRVDHAALDAHVARRKEEELSGLGARPGVSRLLGQADAAGLARSVVSNSPTDWITRYARQCGVDRGWHAIHSAEGDTARAKPAPHLYREALERLGVRPDEAVAFEDSPNGVRAARAAGVRCVAVPNTMTHPLDFSHADLLLTSFAEAELAEILQAVHSLGHQGAAPPDAGRTPRARRRAPIPAPPHQEEHHVRTHGGTRTDTL